MYNGASKKKTQKTYLFIFLKKLLNLKYFFEIVHFFIPRSVSISIKQDIDQIVMNWHSYGIIPANYSHLIFVPIIINRKIFLNKFFTKKYVKI